jgi:hypothetical protein
LTNVPAVRIVAEACERCIGNSTAITRYSQTNVVLLFQTIEHVDDLRGREPDSGCREQGLGAVAAV